MERSEDGSEEEREEWIISKGVEKMERSEEDGKKIERSEEDGKK